MRDRTQCTTLWCAHRLGNEMLGADHTGPPTPPNVMCLLAEHYEIGCRPHCTDCGVPTSSTMIYYVHITLYYRHRFRVSIGWKMRDWVQNSLNHQLKCAQWLDNERLGSDHTVPLTVQGPLAGAISWMQTTQFHRL